MNLIAGVRTKQLKVIPDERGYLMEMSRCDDELFVRFGQVYMTVAFPAVVKGWRYHKEQDDIFVAIKGGIKLVLYDQRAGSPTFGLIKEFFVGERNPILVTIPAGVVHAFKAIGVKPPYIINVSEEPYHYDDPDEFRIHPHDPSIPYDWSLKEG